MLIESTERFPGAPKRGTTKDQPIAIPAHVRLSDGSLAFNIFARIGGREVVFACVSKEHADTLRNAINECAWIEVAR